jgi:hypothetical protein
MRIFLSIISTKNSLNSTYILRSINILFFPMARKKGLLRQVMRNTHLGTTFCKIPFREKLFFGKLYLRDVGFMRKGLDILLSECPKGCTLAIWTDEQMVRRLEPSSILCMYVSMDRKDTGAGMVCLDSCYLSYPTRSPCQNDIAMPIWE